jgi:hypothetical protein
MAKRSLLPMVDQNEEHAMICWYLLVLALETDLQSEGNTEQPQS